MCLHRDVFQENFSTFLKNMAEKNSPARGGFFGRLTSFGGGGGGVRVLSRTFVLFSNHHLVSSFPGSFFFRCRAGTLFWNSISFAEREKLDFLRGARTCCLLPRLSLSLFPARARKRSPESIRSIKQEPRKKVTKAKLGNNSEFYYDETLKAWVDGSDPNGKDAARQAMGGMSGPPPPMMNANSGGGGSGGGGGGGVGGGLGQQQQLHQQQPGNSFHPQQQQQQQLQQQQQQPFANRNQQIENDPYNPTQQQQNFGSDAMHQQQNNEDPASTSNSNVNAMPPPMPSASSFVARQSDVRSRYVDVFNPTGADASDGGAGAQSLSGSAADIASFLPPPIAVAKPQKFFVPGPSAKDEDEAKNGGKLENESPHYVENQQVLSPTKRESPHHISDDNNSNAFSSDGEHHQQQQQEQQQQQQRQEQHFNQFQPGSPAVPENEALHYPPPVEQRQNGLISNSSEQQPQQPQQLMYDQWGNLIEQQLPPQPPSATGSMRSEGHESTSQFDAYIDQNNQYPTGYDQTQHEAQHQQVEYDDDDDYLRPPQQMEQQQMEQREQEQQNYSESPRVNNDGCDYAPPSPRISEDGTVSATTADNNNMNAAFMPPSSADGFAPPPLQAETAPPQPPPSGDGYDYDFSNEIMSSVPYDESKGNEEEEEEEEEKRKDDNDDDKGEGDDGNEGQEQPPFNPDDYPGWVLDEASGAWYYAGDGEEEDQYVEGEEGEYEYDTTGWIEREVYDDVAAKLADAEVMISDKNVEIDAMKNENENLRLKQTDAAADLEQAEREVAELKLKVEQLQNQREAELTAEQLAEAEERGYKRGYHEATKHFEEEMNDLLMCLGQSERACERLKEKLAETGADVDAILEELEAEEDEELNRLFAQATVAEESEASAKEEQATPPQSPSSARKKNNVLGDLEFPDAPDSPFVGADSTTEDRDDDDNERTREDHEEEEMENAKDGAFVIPNAPAGVAESDVSAFFADFHLPTPPRGQGIVAESKAANGEKQEVGEEKKHLNFEDAKEDEKEKDGDATESDKEEQEALTEIQL